jgi:hypothetical protein
MRELKKNSRYRHFKGNWYFAMDYAYHSETAEVFVLYYPEAEKEKLFVRPASMFFEEVPEGKENPTGQPFRFMAESELSL